MKAAPIHCQHGRIVCWYVTGVVLADPVPAVESCDRCDTLRRAADGVLDRALGPAKRKDGWDR